MKKTQIDRAIEQLQGEIAVLQLAVDRLKAQQAKVTNRKPRAVSKPADISRPA